MTWLLRLLLVSLLAVPVLVTASAPAVACSCAESTPRQTARGAVDVLVVTLADDPSEAAPGVIEAQAEVTHVYKGAYTGDPEGEVRVATQSEESMCGKTGLEAGDTWLIYGTVADGVVWVGSCGGSLPADDRSLAEAERLLGPGRDVGSGQPSPDAPAAGDDRVGDEAEDDALPAWAWGVGGALVVLAAAVLVARLSVRDARRR